MRKSCGSGNKLMKSIMRNKYEYANHLASLYGEILVLILTATVSMLIQTFTEGRLV